jgi:very-short-patch-repair endonuclease
MSRPAEELIAALAARQHGLVTRAQVLNAGLTADMLEYRVKAKRLRPVHSGVYRVGPLVTPASREMAAVLACGPGSVVSHRSAAALWQLLAHAGDHAPVDITVQGCDRGRRQGIRPHRVARLEPDEVTKLDGIPITTPARTVIDLAGGVSGRELAQAVAQAGRRQLTSDAALLSLIARHPGRRGIRALRALLRSSAEPALTRSEAEERFLALIRKAQLAMPEVNVMVGGYEIDFLWRAECVAVEVDGYAFHSSQGKFESDRRRDARLSASGLRVIRATWRQLVSEPEAMLVRLAQTLAWSARR